MPTANDIYQELKRLFPEVQCELLYQNIFQLLISVILSAQTTDIAVNKVTPKLFKKYPSVFKLANAEEKDVHDLIKTIGLANTKARNIINLSKKLISDKKGNIEADFDYLITLPGVGRKTANVVLSEGFKIPRIAVDTHVLRVSNRLNLVATDNLLSVENTLMRLYDESLWHLVHLRLLFFGRYFCKAKSPNCDICSFSSSCQYYTKKHLIE